jgi:hypothetical protein
MTKAESLHIESVPIKPCRDSHVNTMHLATKCNTDNVAAFLLGISMYYFTTPDCQQHRQL